MPRRPRLNLPETPQHVIQRGVDRQPVFFCDDDCWLYLDWLGKHVRDRAIALHAYCLMTNHVHLLLTAPSAEALGKLMQDMGRRYVQYINRTYKRSGGLWQGRYKASYVQAECYLFTCMRYIELNPVRACMVTAPGEYRWSSYQANALGTATTLLTPHPEYLALGGDATTRQQAYRTLFTAHLDDADWNLIRTATQQGVVVGESRFVEAIEQRLGCVARPKSPGRPALARHDRHDKE